MPSFRFPLQHRLNKSVEFDAVFKDARYRISLPTLLILAKHNGQGFNRLGMIVSKKNLPRAVDRNRVKRQVREAFRTLLGESAGLDVIILARPGVRAESRLGDVLADVFARVSRQVEDARS